MRILLFGGTTEGRTLAERLATLGHAVTVCVATELGAEELRHAKGLKVMVGRIPAEEIAAMAGSYELCVDATHPYAEHISQSVRAACEERNVPLRRILRKPGEEGDCVVVPDQKSAAAFLAEQTGNIMLTTGSKELAAYAGLDPERIYARLLPTHAGLDACEALGLPHRNIIAMQGPFSAELNEVLFRQFGIRWVVTKDGGAAGGFEEKRTAAKRVGARVILIRRPQEDGITPEELIEEITGGLK